MILTIITHTIAFGLGAGAMMAYLHKHEASAIADATKLAADAATAKADLADLKNDKRN
jgi:hypothetical protein